MITRLLAPGTERIFDGEVGRFVERSAIPCHQCGVCCERWQPLVSAAEAARLAAFLEMDEQDFAEAYTAAYPLDDAVRLLGQRDGACVFLRHEADGRARCSVHPARPDVCRAWTASLDRRECIDGLRRFGTPDTVVPIRVIYASPGDRGAFAATARGEEAGDAG
jgi:Fe-S-cluster containining protein